MKPSEESAVPSTTIRIPYSEVSKYLAGSKRHTGTSKYIYLWGIQLLRKDYPNGIITEADDKNQVYIIRKA